MYCYFRFRANNFDSEKTNGIMNDHIERVWTSVKQIIIIIIRNATMRNSTLLTHSLAYIYIETYYRSCATHAINQLLNFCMCDARHHWLNMRPTQEHDVHSTLLFAFAFPIHTHTHTHLHVHSLIIIILIMWREKKYYL